MGPATGRTSVEQLEIGWLFYDRVPVPRNALALLAARSQRAQSMPPNTCKPIDGLLNRLANGLAKYVA